MQGTAGEYPPIIPHRQLRNTAAMGVWKRVWEWATGLGHGCRHRPIPYRGAAACVGSVAGVVPTP